MLRVEAAVRAPAHEKERDEVQRKHPPADNQCGKGARQPTTRASHFLAAPRRSAWC